MELKEKRNKKKGNFIKSVSYCLDGFFYIFKNESHFRFHVFAFILVVLFSIFLKITKLEFLIILLASGLVFVSEILNTALEVLVDMITDKTAYFPKVIKDLGALAVLTSAFVAFIAGAFIFVPKIIILFGV